MTQKQRRLAKNLGTVRTNEEAMLLAGYSPSTAHQQSKILNSPTWRKMLDTYLKDETLIGIHLDGFTASKWNDFTGEREADHNTRFRYLDSAYKLKGRYPKDNDQQVGEARTYVYNFYGDTDPFKRQYDALHGTDPQQSGPVSSAQLAPQGPQDDAGDLPTGSVGS